MLHDKRAKIEKCFSELDCVDAVYPMPEKALTGVVRLAVVINEHPSGFYSQLQEITQELELEFNTIIDFFIFNETNNPPCKNEEVLYSKNSNYSSIGNKYDPYNENDSINESKIVVIEEFAQKLKDNPLLQKALENRLQDSNYFRGGLEKEYEIDWYNRIKNYPVELLISFLMGRSNHLKRISPSSPILMFQREWRAW